MSKTYRNKNSVPKGYKVRDGKPDLAFDCDNVVYCTGTHYYVQYINVVWANDRLAKYTRCIKAWRRSVLRKDKKDDRKRYYRQYRAKCKDRMSHEDWDNIPRFVKTSGWLTW